MPELPEVETVARQLAPLLRGQRILRVRVLDTKLQGFALETLVGDRIATVKRIGKQVALEVVKESSKRSLLIHLRMSGRLLWRGRNSAIALTVPNELVHESSVSPKHIRLTLECDDGEMDFVDPRRFGTCVLYESEQGMPHIGVDPIGSEFTLETFTKLLREARQPLKPWLLRQDRIVGLGNIYASEILFRAGLSPFRTPSSLKAKEIARLHLEVQNTLLQAIEMCGTTFSDFQQSNGEAGGFQHFLTVYEREGEGCTRCKGSIRREVQGGRSTYHCAACQR